MKNRTLTSGTEDNKKLILRLIGFVLALAAAGAAFAYGFTSLGHKDPGHQLIEAATEESALRYAAGVEFQYWFEGDSNAIKLEVKELSAIYSPILLRAYELTDAENEYDDLVNLASLNAHPGETLTVAPELWSALKDAYEKTLRQEGYNLFAGPIYRYWTDLLYLTDPSEFDPAVSENEAERLEKLSAATADLSNFSLTFPAENQVSFTVSKKYQSLLAELEITGPILDLNLLREAYELETVAADLAAAGYDNGYLATDSGLTVLLARHDPGQSLVYGPHEKEAVPAAGLTVPGGRAVSQFHTFPYVAGKAGFYTVEGRQRSIYVPASGVNQDVLTAAMTAAESPVDAVYENIRLFALDSAQAVRDLALDSQAEVFWILADGSMAVHTNSKNAYPVREYGWSLTLDRQ